jgi:arylsulfatase A
MRSRLCRLVATGSLSVLVACGSNTPTAPAAVAPSPSPTPLAPPNVVVLVADDLGYGDLPSYGNTGVSMPAFDRLVAEGMRFTSFYTPAPVCQPSRASLMTGRYPLRTGVIWNGGAALSHSELTAADLLHARGYRTAIIGKWHLGFDTEDMPVHYGFDTFSGTAQGSSTNTEWIHGDQRTDSVPLAVMDERVTRESVELLRQYPGDKPLFLYIGSRLPHEPYLPSSQYAGHSRSGEYGDVLEQLDGDVGQLMKAIQDSKFLAGNTLFLFLSDNGPTGLGSPGPLSGGKSSVGEAGVRVPAIAWWPGHIPAARVMDEITSTMDVVPTLVTLAGGSLPAGRVYDGMDISGLIQGRVDRLTGAGIDGRRELVFWLSAYDAQGNVLENRAAIRSGRWKYFNWVRSLYDVDHDLAEAVDVSRDHPDIAARLAARMFEIGP